jgi:hypothetical protein
VCALIVCPLHAHTDWTCYMCLLLVIHHSHTPSELQLQQFSHRADNCSCTLLLIPRLTVNFPLQNLIILSMSDLFSRLISSFTPNKSMNHESAAAAPPSAQIARHQQPSVPTEHAPAAASVSAVVPVVPVVPLRADDLLASVEFEVAAAAAAAAAAAVREDANDDEDPYPKGDAVVDGAEEESPAEIMGLASGVAVASPSPRTELMRQLAKYHELADDSPFDQRNCQRRLLMQSIVETGRLTDRDRSLLELFLEYQFDGQDSDWDPTSARELRDSIDGSDSGDMGLLLCNAQNLLKNMIEDQEDAAGHGRLDLPTDAEQLVEQDVEDEEEIEAQFTQLLQQLQILQRHTGAPLNWGDLRPQLRALSVARLEASQECCPDSGGPGNALEDAAHSMEERFVSEQVLRLLEACRDGAALRARATDSSETTAVQQQIDTCQAEHKAAQAALERSQKAIARLVATPNFTDAHLADLVASHRLLSAQQTQRSDNLKQLRTQLAGAQASARQASSVSAAPIVGSPDLCLSAGRSVSDWLSSLREVTDEWDSDQCSSVRGLQSCLREALLWLLEVTDELIEVHEEILDEHDEATQAARALNAALEQLDEAIQARSDALTEGDAPDTPDDTDAARPMSTRKRSAAAMEGAPKSAAVSTAAAAGSSIAPVVFSLSSLRTAVQAHRAELATFAPESLVISKKEEETKDDDIDANAVNAGSAAAAAAAAATTNDPPKCTFTSVQKFVNQASRCCLTCDPTGGWFLCLGCVSAECHGGHELGPLQFSMMYCDCGAQSKPVRCLAPPSLSRSSAMDLWAPPSLSGPSATDLSSFVLRQWREVHQLLLGAAPEVEGEQSEDDEEEHAVTDAVTGGIDEACGSVPGASDLAVLWQSLARSASILAEQLRVSPCLDRSGVALLCREIAQDYRNDVSWGDAAFEALQTAAEDFMLHQFDAAAGGLASATKYKRQKLDRDHGEYLEAKKTPASDIASQMQRAVGDGVEDVPLCTTCPVGSNPAFEFAPVDVKFATMHRKHPRGQWL